MISISNLGRSYGAQTLFLGVSIQFNPGELYGLVGANGSGKSTFLRILAGDEEPSDNDDHLAQLKTLIRFDVADPNAWTSLSAAIRRIGAGSGVDVLTQACADFQWGWCFESRGIVVASAAAQYRQRLMLRGAACRRHGRAGHGADYVCCNTPSVGTLRPLGVGGSLSKEWWHRHASRQRRRAPADYRFGGGGRRSVCGAVTGNAVPAGGNA